MRKALIVGIDHYDHISPLGGAVQDAYSVKSVLERNADGTLNFATPAGGQVSPNSEHLRPPLSLESGSRKMPCSDGCESRLRA